MRDVEARMADGKLFHTRGAATENARLPKVDRRTGGTIRVDVAEDTWFNLWTAQLRTVTGFGRMVRLFSD